MPRCNRSAKRVTNNPHVGDSDIEIRPVFSPEEFEALLPPEANAQHERLHELGFKA